MSAYENPGVALFNTPSQDGESGVYCIAGKEPTRFVNRTALPSHVRWWTNAHLPHHQQEPNILAPTFASVTPNNILHELGVEKRSLAHQAYVLSTVISTVVQITKQAYPEVLPESAGIQALYELMPLSLRQRDTADPHEYKPDLIRAGMGQHTVNTPFHNESTLVSLTLPRYQHAQHVLAVGLPQGRWVKLESKRIGPKSKRMQWLKNQTLPTISRVRITRVAKPLGDVIQATFSNPFMEPGDSNYFYATGLELIYLNTVADVVIDEVYLASNQLSPSANLPFTDPLAQMSWSYGVLCENHWKALCRGQDGRVKHTFQSFWLRANDRIRCLVKAVELIRRGYIVRSLGSGRVNIALEPHMGGRLYRDCVELKISPPMAATPHPIFLPTQPTAEDFTIQLFLQANLNHLFSLDRQLISRNAID